MPSRSCNTRILVATADTYRGVARSLPAPTRASIVRALSAARVAAERGRCADMHKSAQAARAKLNLRLDMLLGRPRRRRR
jgi:hypothetical protein